PLRGCTAIIYHRTDETTTIGRMKRPVLLFLVLALTSCSESQGHPTGMGGGTTTSSGTTSTSSGGDLWVEGGFGPCSFSCGGGRQTETVTWRASDESTVNDSSGAGPKPPSSRACNTQACPALTAPVLSPKQPPASSFPIYNLMLYENDNLPNLGRPDGGGGW